MKKIVKIGNDLSISRIRCELPDESTGIAYSAKEKAVAFYCSSDGTVGFVDEREVRFVPRRVEVDNPVGMCCDKWGIIMLQISHDMLWNFNQSFENGMRFCGASLFNSIGQTWPSDAKLFAPFGMCRISEDTLLVTTPWNHKAIALRHGHVAYHIGCGRCGFATSNSMAAAKFANPMGICFDDVNDTILISDTGNKVVRLFKGGREVAFVGLPGTAGKSDGHGSEARLSRPAAIVASSGMVAFADDNLLRTFKTASLDVSTPYASANEIVDVAMGGGCIYVLEDSP